MENKNSEVVAPTSIDTSRGSNVHSINNILQLNDDCLIEIMKNLKLIDLCAVAETCTCLKWIAGEVFKKRKTYCIPQTGVRFKDHQRILKNFGNLVTAATCVTNFGDIVLSKGQIISAFKWLERYCSESLQQLSMFGICTEEIDLPPSAIRLMAKLQKIDFSLPISDQVLRSALRNCKELKELNLMMYDGPFHFQDYHFPQLQKLWNRVNLNRNTDFNKIETFFQHHTKLTDLRTQFLHYRGDRAIDFAYLKHLPHLKKLSLILAGAPVENIDAFAYLRKLEEFSVDNSSERQTDALILKNLASVDSLAKLVLAFPEVSHLITGIERFKKLSNLQISLSDTYPHGLDEANISSLAQIHNSSLTELEVNCLTLLEPESIVNVVCNLKQLKIVKMCCEMELSEKICRDLANVCSSQDRKLLIILEKEMVDHMNFNFDFIEKFNKKHGSFVEVKIECVPIEID